MYKVVNCYCSIDKSYPYKRGFSDGYLVGIYISFLAWIIYNILSIVINRDRRNIVANTNTNRAEEEEAETEAEEEPEGEAIEESIYEMEEDEQKEEEEKSEDAKKDD